MPRDLDEDPAPPAPRPPAVARPPVTTPVTATPAKLAWGACGVFHEAGELTAHPGARGVIRFVSGGVSYTSPPFDTAGWRVVPTEPGRYEMPWPGDPSLARTLADFRGDLDRAVRRGQLTDPGHPLLAELDRVADRLVTAAAKLHRGRWSLGLLRPDNVLLRDSPDGPEPVLVDLGFAWRGSHGAPPWDDSPGRPDWLAAEHPAGWLWDDAAVRRQFADPGNGVYPPMDPTADVRTLGRLIAWLLTGQAEQLVLEVHGSDLWAALAAAASGRLSSADELAARLRAAPPSTHFAAPKLTPPPPPPLPPKPKRWPAVAALVAVLAVCLFFAWWLTSGPRQTEVAQATNRTDPDAGDVSLSDPAKPTSPSGGPGALPEADPAKLEARKKYLSSWTQRYKDVSKEAADPARRLDAGRTFLALYMELKDEVEKKPSTDPDTHKREQQCLALAQATVRQYGPLP